MKKIMMLFLGILLLIGCSKFEKEEEVIVKENSYYQMLSNMNNVNEGFITEDEDYLYIAKSAMLLKVNKKTNETIDLLENKNINLVTNLRLYNNKIYFFTPKTATHDDIDTTKVNEEIAKYIEEIRKKATEATLYSMNKDGSNLTKVIEDKDERGMVNLAYIDNFIYYNTKSGVGSYNAGNYHEKFEYDLITKKNREINDLSCLYLYDNKANIVCIRKLSNSSEIELALLNKQTLETERIKTGIFDRAVLDYQPIYVNNSLYFNGYVYSKDNNDSFLRKLEKFDLTTNELKTIIDLDDFLEENLNKEEITNFIVKDDVIYITTSIIKFYNVDIGSVLNHNSSLYRFENNELTKLYGATRPSFAINLTEKYVVVKDISQIKAFDHFGNEKKIIKE